MPVGLQIINDHGTVQIDQDSFCLTYHSKGTQVLNARNQKSYSGGNQQLEGPLWNVWQNNTSQGGPPSFGGSGGLLAFRASNGLPVGVGWNASNRLAFLGYNTGNTAPQVEWWYFSRPAARSSGEGLEVYDASGGVAYTTAGKVMSIVSVANDSAGGVSAPGAGDWALAVGSPFPCVREYQYQSGQFAYQELSPLWNFDGVNFSRMDAVTAVRLSQDTGQFQNGRVPQATQMVINVSGL